MERQLELEDLVEWTCKHCGEKHPYLEDRWIKWACLALYRQGVRPYICEPVEAREENDMKRRIGTVQISKEFVCEELHLPFGTEIWGCKMSDDGRYILLHVEHEDLPEVERESNERVVAPMVLVGFKMIQSHWIIPEERGKDV